jgi:hypothetical protein
MIMDVNYKHKSDVEKQVDFFTNRFELFLRSVQKIYTESWVSFTGCSKINRKVIRGRARCVAGQVEDLFGETVYDILNKHIKGLIVFVDLPLSYERNDNGKRLKTICYPDVVVAQRNESQIRILYLMEMKVNFGWGRHKLVGEGMFKNDKTGKKERRSVTPIEDDVKGVLQKLIGVKIWSKIPYGMTAKKNSTEVTKNSELQFVVSKDTKYDLIICSSKNVPKDALQKARERIGEDVNAVCQLYVLSDKELSLKYASKKQRPEGDSLLCSKDVNKWKCRINALVDGWLQYKK